ncbi:MAG: VCBS repeat-containing protein [Planctomycetes bacterium]|nr:VCBS repeat-containing protein [Planctomycetota bacterium]MCC7171014.1 VCBS repeat-containing protein [Planctomycetota bacterium]
MSDRVLFRCARVLLAAASLFVSDAAARQGAPPRYLAEYTVVTEEPERVAVGDMNEDGRVDAIVASRFPGRVFVLLGDGFGALTLHDEHEAGEKPMGLVVDDFDGDGHLDVCTLNRDTFDLRVFRGDGTGRIEFAARGPIGYEPLALASANLDSDPAAEVIATQSSGITSVFQFVTNGQFTRTHAFNHGAVRDMCAADFTGDGIVDLAFSGNFLPLRVWVVPGNGLGGFGPPIVTPTPTFSLLNLLAHDVDSDGRQDLVSYGGFTAPFGRVLLGVGDGTFGAFAIGAPFATAPKFSSELSPMAAGDFDGDSDQDILVGRVLYRNLGDTTFDVGTVMQVNPFDFALADVDGDVAPDLVCIGKSTWTVTAVRGHPHDAFETTDTFLSIVGGQAGNAVLQGELADVDGDGDLDVVAAERSANALVTHLGDGRGGFVIGPVTPLSPLPFLASPIPIVGDIDSDGLVDVVVDDRTQLLVARGSGNGAFQQTATLPLPTLGTVPLYEDVRLGDADGDGDLDVFALATDQTLWVHRQASMASFVSVPTKLPSLASNEIGSFVVFDADGDGDDDALTFSVVNEAMTVFHSTSAGPLATGATTAIGMPLWSPLLADFDADGAIDVAGVTWHPTGVAVAKRHGQGAFAPFVTSDVVQPLELSAAGDWDRDGVVDLIGNGPRILRGIGGLKFETGRAFTQLTPFPWSRQPVGDVDGDGWLDVVQFGLALDTPLTHPAIFVLRTTCHGSAAAHGLGCSFGGVPAPSLRIRGCAEADSTLSLVVTGAQTASLAWIVFGTQPGTLPLGSSGCSLAMSSLLPASVFVPVNPATGESSIPLTIPAGFASLTVELQAILPTTVSPMGFVTSNALTIVVD